MEHQKDKTKIIPAGGWAAEERRRQEEADDEEREAPAFRVHTAEGDMIRMKGADAVLCPLEQEAFRTDICMPKSRRITRMNEGTGGRILAAAEPGTAQDLCLKLARKNPAITAARIPGLLLPFRWLFPVFLTDGTAENIADRVRNALSAADFSGCASIAIPFFKGKDTTPETAALAIAGAVRNWALDHPARTLSDVWLIGKTRMETLLLADAAWTDPEPVPEHTWGTVQYAGSAGHIRLETGTGPLLDTDTDAAGFLLSWQDEQETPFSRCLAKARLPERHILPGGHIICSGGILPFGHILASREALPVGQEAPEDAAEQSLRRLLDAAERAECRSISLPAKDIRDADLARNVITRWSEEHPLSCLGAVRFVSRHPEALLPFRVPEEADADEPTRRPPLLHGMRLFAGRAV